MPSGFPQSAASDALPTRSSTSDHASPLRGFRRSILVSAEFFLYVRCKLPDTIYKDPHPGLREYALVALDHDRGIIRIPRRTNCSRSECGRKRHDIWSNRVFTVVISNEVSDEGVTNAWARPCAMAPILARFPSDDSLTK